MTKDKFHNYYGTVLSVYDGDTCTVEFDLGFSILFREKVRLYGIDTPEIRTRDKDEKKRGYEAKEFLEEKILGKRLKFKVFKEGKFGRFLVYIYLKDGSLINKTLVHKGFAKEYFGGKR